MTGASQPLRGQSAIQGPVSYSGVRQPFRGQSMLDFSSLVPSLPIPQ